MGMKEDELWKNMACETKNIFDNHKTLISKEHWKTKFSVLLQVTVNHKVFIKNAIIQ
ncbi:hypothetical protein XBFM1_1100003 [Xenorhabdus bovienii str. feltiae Moldova]|uniref:Uncharacterized protein n=1 Tax=Xenorhabdus bovienii str. feltiae Moldova TaxID=1398200 RepID=A0A077NBQ9_XENBV|nr:hypothetical protein XBFM1_1100003 [Xenorhabdus bovienii str. feltiae Moldova]